jgi:hypothetical protein
VIYILYNYDNNAAITMAAEHQIGRVKSNRAAEFWCEALVVAEAAMSPMTGEACFIVLVGAVTAAGVLVTPPHGIWKPLLSKHFGID